MSRKQGKATIRQGAFLGLLLIKYNNVIFSIINLSLTITGLLMNYQSRET